MLLAGLVVLASVRAPVPLSFCFLVFLFLFDLGGRFRFNWASSAWRRLDSVSNVEKAVAATKFAAARVAVICACLKLGKCSSIYAEIWLYVISFPLGKSMSNDSKL